MFSRRITAIAALAAAVAIFAGPSNGASRLAISTCDQVVTANAVVTKDLTCSGTDGIIVDASRITIDLGGHTLTGDQTHYGIVNAGHLDVTIKNGVLRKFNRGVSAYAGADNMKLSNVVLVGNFDVGAYVNGNSVSVAASTATGNGGNGIFVYGNSATVKSSTASANGHYGMYVWGDSASIRSAVTTGNASDGILVIGAAASVKSSSAVGNAAFGLDLQGDATSVASSSASGNGQSGIWITGDSSSVKGTKASGNGAYGIVAIGDAATVSGNRAEANGFPGAASDNSGLGIYVDTFSTAPVGKNVVRGNDDPANCQPASLCTAPAVQTAKAGWTPITACGQTVTADAAVTKDLDCAGGPGVVVGASGITIDLQGHTLSGDSLHFGVFDETGYDDLTVENGVVREFLVGIGAYKGADNVTVSNVVSTGSALNGLVVAGNSAAIASSTVSGNGDGIFVGGSRAAIKSATVTGNVKSAITVSGDDASITSSLAAGNGSGVAVNGKAATVKSSTASGNGYIGFYLEGDGVSVTSSTASGNAAYGLEIVGDAAALKSTTASGNTYHGLYVSGDAARLTGNRADGNGFAAGASDGFGLGIYADSFTTAPVGKNVARGNDDGGNCQPASVC